jgi:hypothetical protein
MALTYLKKYKKDINPEIWNIHIDPVNAVTALTSRVVVARTHGNEHGPDP